MVCLIAMQGLGKPGVNMGNLQWGTPQDFNFYFPGYADGGMSGDLRKTSMSVALYQRMPQLPSINTNTQVIPRMQLTRSDHRRQGRRLRMGRHEHRGSIHEDHVPQAGVLSGAHALQVRRLPSYRPCRTATATSGCSGRRTWSLSSTRTSGWRETRCSPTLSCRPARTSSDRTSASGPGSAAMRITARCNSIIASSRFSTSASNPWGIEVGLHHLPGNL